MILLNLYCHLPTTMFTSLLSGLQGLVYSLPYMYFQTLCPFYPPTYTSSLSQSALATIVRYHRLGVINKYIYFSSSRDWKSRLRSPLSALFLVCRCLPFPLSPHMACLLMQLQNWEREKEKERER